jgi:hypothetical protein
LSGRSDPWQARGTSSFKQVDKAVPRQRLLLPFLVGAALGWPAVAARPAPTLPPADLGYADVADLALAAPVVLVATIDRVDPLKAEEAPDAPAGFRRAYVEADVASLIRGEGGLPSRVRYLVDMPADGRGRLPKLRGARTILFAQSVPDQPGELRLIAADAQLGWSEPLEAQARAILKEALSADDPPRVTRVGNAFYVPGSLPGEGETQVFLQTADGRPISLNVLRRPGEEPRWAVALGEMVDEAAVPPAPETLLWYRLACTLPPRLPARSTASLDGEAAAAAAEDYRVILGALGPCDRRRPAR